MKTMRKINETYATSPIKSRLIRLEERSIQHIPPVSINSYSHKTTNPLRKIHLSNTLFAFHTNVFEYSNYLGDPWNQKSLVVLEWLSRESLIPRLAKLCVKD